MRRFEVVEDSMVPNFHPGDYLVATRGQPRRGDAVVFLDAGRGLYLLKRAIGLEGERIEIRDGSVHVDGRRLDEHWGGSFTPGKGEWFVAPGTVFVLSDARGVTDADSRTLGPIPTAGMWRVVMRYRRGPRSRRMPSV
jgi:signal peptidase I